MNKIINSDSLGCIIRDCDCEHVCQGVFGDGLYWALKEEACWVMHGEGDSRRMFQLQHSEPMKGCGGQGPSFCSWSKYGEYQQ